MHGDEEPKISQTREKATFELDGLVKLLQSEARVYSPSEILEKFESASVAHV